MTPTFRIGGCKRFRRLYCFQLCVAISLALTSVIFLSERAYSDSTRVKVKWSGVRGSLIGYKVYWGQSSRNYTNNANARYNRTYTIKNLSCQTYYIAIEAYKRYPAGLLQSAFSNELVIEGLSASAGSHGRISPKGIFFKSQGASQTFNITPDRGYKVSSVLVDGTPVGAVTSYTLSNITASHTISATFGTVPLEPTEVTAAVTAGSTEASVSFKLPGSNGVSTITGYTVTSNPGGITARGVGSPITVTGLTYGTAYEFTVTATNQIGTGKASEPSNSVTPEP